MGVNRKNLNCAISWKRLIMGRNKCKFRTVGARTEYIVYFPCPILWVHFGVLDFVHIPALRFLTGCLHSSHSVSTKLYGLYGNYGKIQAITFLHLHTPPNPTCSRWYDHEWLKADYKPDSPTHHYFSSNLPNLKKVWLFQICANIGSSGAGNPILLSSDLIQT